MVKRIARKSRRRANRRHRGGQMLLQKEPLVQAQPGGISQILPTTDWARWAAVPQAYQWSPSTGAPAALANGGQYTNPQSTAPWGSSPFPATQYAWAVEAAKTSGLPEVAYHLRPNDNYGSSYSPVTGTPITPSMWSASGPAGVMHGGRRTRRNRRRI